MKTLKENIDFGVSGLACIILLLLNLKTINQDAVVGIILGSLLIGFVYKQLS